jgi:hypothetical protein
MDKLPKLEHTYSQELDEILGTIPPTVIRFGITIIFIIFCTILTGSYFFKYPTIVSVPIELTTLNSPAPLVSRISGRIDKWFVADGQIVESGSPIALLQSTASYDDMMLLQTKLLALTGNWQVDIQNANFPQRLILGDVQDAYLNFHAAVTRLKHYVEQNSISHKLHFHEQLIRLNKERYDLNLKQKAIKERQFEIARDFFSKDSLLFEQHRFGIAKREYDLSFISILQERESLLAFDATLKSLESSTKQMEQEVVDLKLAHIETLNEYVTLTHESKQLLENKITAWIENSVLVSPIRGKVTFTNFWSSNQVITSGQSLATIIPLENALIIGHAHISSSELALVEVGQDVNIKLAGFPFMEYGYIQGRVRTISLVPEKKNYIVEIELPNGMVSNYSEKLKFVHEMEGVAEIKIKDARLIY